jgi:CRP-like cAMP-binding protein
MTQRTFKNILLNALDEETIARLCLEPVTFEIKQQIEIPGATIRDLYFVEEGMASMTTAFANGAEVEVCMFGYEGVIGASALMGIKRSLNRVYTQIAGRGFCCPLTAAKQEFARGGLFESLVLRYVQTQLVQSMQSTGCNAQHAVDQRLARWLLICADRAQTTTFKMSHDYLSLMLGNSRPAVSQAAAILKEAGLIIYTRGVIQIPDVNQLRAKACECYQIVRDYIDEVDDEIPVPRKP